jgi:ABC-type antimicrobial peptide transport system permease subunit
VLGSGLIVIGIGIPAGLGAAAFSSRFVESQLFGVGSLDPVVYAGAAIALAAVVIAASLGPAMRASRANPVDVLRNE